MPHTAGSTWVSGERGATYGRRVAGPVAQKTVHNKSRGIHLGAKDERPKLMKTSWVCFVGRRCWGNPHGFPHARKRSQSLSSPAALGANFKTRTSKLQIKTAAT